MKKIIISLLMMVLLASLTLAAAPSSPIPVKGYVYSEGAPAQGYPVEVTNDRTGEVLTYLQQPGLKTENGIYFFLLNDFKQGVITYSEVYRGDKIIIRFGMIIREFNAKPSVYYPEDIEIGAYTLPPEPVICPTCEVCKEPIVCPEVPETDENDYLVYIVGILSAIGGAGLWHLKFNNKIFIGTRTGMKTYRGRDGDIKIQHKHPGTTGYHDPNTVHRKPENHPKGKIDVGTNYYKVNDKWEYRG